MGAVFIAAVHFCYFTVFYNDFHHAAGIRGAAVAGEKHFFFHLLFLRDAEAHGGQAQPIGSHRLQIVTQQYISCGDLPGIGISVYINLQFLAIQSSGKAQTAIACMEKLDIAQSLNGASFATVSLDWSSHT